MGIFDSWRLPKQQLSKREEQRLKEKDPKKYQKYIERKVVLKQQGIQKNATRQKSLQPVINYDEIYRRSYQELKNSTGYPSQGSKTVLIDGRKYQLWRSDDTIIGIPLFPTQFDIKDMIKVYGEKPKWDVFRLCLSSILYFEQCGELRTDTMISGGGSNIAGAIIGGVLAGQAGAIIGSREPIKAEPKTTDTRESVIVCQNKTYHLSWNDYNALLALIPEKEISVVKSTQQSSKTTDTVEKMRQLNAMREEGLITQVEYDTKKAEILNRM